jgi:tRNA pseudouridine13 synthase
MLPTLAYLHGKPLSQGQLRTKMSDFQVFEKLPFAFSGEGEHLLIHIRKTGVNTIVVARQLAHFFSIKEMFVTYAGLKDRYAVTEQWFGLHLPGKTVDVSSIDIEGVEVLSSTRHNKKLRIGALSGNNFSLILRNVTEVEALEKRWSQIIKEGVPNYFGEQRFGIDGGNVDKAIALFGGSKVRDKKKRGIYLSAARSYLFNQAIHQRIEHDYFSVLSSGDVCMLAGTQSVFVVDDVDDTLLARMEEKDIDITAPMWGSGELMTRAEPLIFEQQVAKQCPEIVEGLPKFGLKQERRRIRLSLSETRIEVDRADENIEGCTVTLHFFLPSGCYATTILRELIDYQDMTDRTI